MRSKLSAYDNEGNNGMTLPHKKKKGANRKIEMIKKKKKLLFRV
jgi:hypothetical protein